MQVKMYVVAITALGIALALIATKRADRADDACVVNMSTNRYIMRYKRSYFVEPLSVTLIAIGLLLPAAFFKDDPTLRISPAILLFTGTMVFTTFVALLQAFAWRINVLGDHFTYYDIYNRQGCDFRTQDILKIEIRHTKKDRPLFGHSRDKVIFHVRNDESSNKRIISLDRRIMGAGLFIEQMHQAGKIEAWPKDNIIT